MIERITTPEPAQPSTLRSLFNAKSMALKFGRDALISTVAYGIPVTQRVAEQFSTYSSADALPMLGVFTLFAASTAVLSSLGRYAGGGIGMACDAAFNAARGEPALKTAYGRKTLAALGGVAAALPLYMSFMMVTGMVDLNVADAPAHPQAVAQAEIPAIVRTPILANR